MIVETPALGDSSVLPMWMRKKRGGAGGGGDAGETVDFLPRFSFLSVKMEANASKNAKNTETWGKRRSSEEGNDPCCC